MKLPGDDFAYKPGGAEIPYEELNLEQPWQQFNIEHELTRKGMLILPFEARHATTAV